MIDNYKSNVTKYLQSDGHPNIHASSVPKNRTHILKIRNRKTPVYIPILPANKHPNDPIRHPGDPQPLGPPHQAQLIDPSFPGQAASLVRYHCAGVPLPEAKFEGDPAAGYALCLPERGSAPGYRQAPQGEGRHREADFRAQGGIGEEMIYMLIIQSLHLFYVKS